MVGLDGKIFFSTAQKDKLLISFDFVLFFFLQFFLEDNSLPPVPVYNSSNETLLYPNGQLIAFTDKNNFYLPVSEHERDYHSL